MAWIESHQSLGRHPKTLRLARTLEITTAQAIGHLHYLWWWALDYAEGGDLTDIEPDVLAIACDWQGDADVLLKALIKAGFVDNNADALTIHDWGAYTGRLVERRAQDRERKREAFQKSSAGVPAEVRRSSGVTDQPTNSVPTVTNKQTDVPLPQTEGATAPAKKRKPSLKLLEKPQDLLAMFSEDELTEATRRFPAADLEWEAGKCLDWHNARSGSANWKLAFKNWLGKAKPPTDNHQNLTGSPDPDKYIKGKYGHLVQR